MVSEQLTEEKILRPAVIITLFSVVNLAVGFALQLILAAKFGTGIQMDAYLAATTIPLLLTIVLFGSLNITFIPVFIEYQVKKDEQEAWRVVSGFFNIMALVLMGFVILGLLFAPMFIQITTPGFRAGSESFELAVELLRLLLLSLICNGLAGLLRSVYYAQRRFFLPALAPVLNNGVVLILTLILADSLGIHSVAIATLVGSIAQFVLLTPILIRRSRYSFRLELGHPGIRKVTVLMLPWMVGAIVSKSNPLIDRFVASRLSEGSISVLGYAYQLMTAIVITLTQGITTALFPSLSYHSVQKDISKLRTSISWGVNLTLFVALPVTALIAILREPLIQLLFERGEFTREATIKTGHALMGYLGALLAMSVGGVLTQALYALQDTRTPTKVGIIGAGINIVLALFLTPVFGYLGPALAFSLVAVFNLTIILFKLRHRLAGIEEGQIVNTSKWIAIATVLMGGVVIAFDQFIDAVGPIDGFGQAMRLVVSFGIGILVYFGAAHLFGVEPARLAVSKMSRRYKT